MNQDKIMALLQVAEEILFSISLPSHVLLKYQNLRNSLLSSAEFSLKKFDSTFSPRLPKNLKTGYMKLAKLCVMSIENILSKTCFILEVSGQTGNQVFEKSFTEIMNSCDQIKDITEVTYHIEDLERKTIENLDMIKDTFTVFRNNLSVLDEEIRVNKVSLRKEENIEAIHIENERILRENESLKDEIKKLKKEWNEELENARVNWTISLDKMQSSYEKNMKDLKESHEGKINALKKISQDKLNLAKETEQRLIAKLEGMTKEQSEVLNKLNDKILFLTAKGNEEANFVEKVMNKIDDIYDNFDLIDKEYCYTNLKDKIISKLDDLEVIFEKNKGNIIKCTKADVKKNVVNLKEKLAENNLVLKEFEDARSKLLLHFVDSPTGKRSSQTTRY